MCDGEWEQISDPSTTDSIISLHHRIVALSNVNQTDISQYTGEFSALGREICEKMEILKTRQMLLHEELKMRVKNARKTRAQCIELLSAQGTFFSIIPTDIKRLIYQYLETSSITGVSDKPVARVDILSAPVADAWSYCDGVIMHKKFNKYTFYSVPSLNIIKTFTSNINTFQLTRDEILLTPGRGFWKIKLSEACANGALNTMEGCTEVIPIPLIETEPREYMQIYKSHFISDGVLYVVDKLTRDQLMERELCLAGREKVKYIAKFNSQEIGDVIWGSNDRLYARAVSGKDHKYFINDKGCEIWRNTWNSYLSFMCGNYLIMRTNSNISVWETLV